MNDFTFFVDVLKAADILIRWIITGWAYLKKKRMEKADADKQEEEAEQPHGSP